MPFFVWESNCLKIPSLHFLSEHFICFILFWNLCAVRSFKVVKIKGFFLIIKMINVKCYIVVSCFMPANSRLILGVTSTNVKPISIINVMHDRTTTNSSCFWSWNNHALENVWSIEKLSKQEMWKFTFFYVLPLHQGKTRVTNVSFWVVKKHLSEKLKFLR